MFVLPSGVQAQNAPSPAGEHSCVIGTPGVNEFIINWTDSKNYTNLKTSISDGTTERGYETWPTTFVGLTAHINENLTLYLDISWHPEKRDPSNVQDIKLDPAQTASQSYITIQGKKALLVKNKERKIYQGTDKSPLVDLASFFACYYPDDYTEVVIRAPASEWKDSEFKAAISSLKVTPPVGYY
jgi:hypothetical protein